MTSPAPTFGSAKSGPTKEFFVNMITKDITLLDSILDLVDNAVAKAIETEKVDVMSLLGADGIARHFSHSRVDINVAATHLEVHDTCGGISLDRAKEDVFVFGNSGAVTKSGGLSVYGIGMKRAFFKVGNQIEIKSATEHDWFTMNINVSNWLRTSGWDFPFSATGTGAPPAGIEKHSTSVSITSLREGVAARFSDQSFQNQLTEKVALTYALFITSGLAIFINGEAVKSTIPQIAVSKEMSVGRKQITFHGVDILIVAGVSPANDDPGGWFVFCNGRLVVGPERTKTTGWEEQLPKWHQKFNHFVGYVYFSSDDVTALPWTTTKHDVIFDSEVYQAALSEMVVQARPVIAFLSRMYPSDQIAEGVTEREILQTSQPVSVALVSQTNTPFTITKTATPAETLISIQYQKPADILAKIRTHLKKRDMSARAIGVHTFDYFVRQELE